MQHISLICLGKLSESYYAAGIAEYTKRLSTLCRLKIVELMEENLNEKKLSSALIKATLEKEAVRIMAAVPKGAQIIALCIEGKQLTSEELSAKLGDIALSGAGHVAFVIGSSHGLADSIKQQASLNLSMSKMTFPHGLARLMLVEQIYRAFMIRRGSKYHK